MTKPNFLIILFYLLAGGIILFLFDGTGGEADSINHYLHAKYAFQHPELFLNHWAKPLFTILASPFAQFGFLGVKIFNLICTTITAVLIHQIAAHFNFKQSHLAPLFLFLFPLSFLTTFSGLTEPLAAALLSAAIYFALKEKDVVAAILISFLPFVRSEGLLFLPVFGIFWLLRKKWKVLPYLVLGHLFFSIIGFFYYKDLLWVFTKIPYATLNSHYGGGKLFHFADQLIYITGVPSLIFFLLGLLGSILKKMKDKTAFLLLIVANLLTFFVAHSLFWYLGIFNSLGLKRVFAAVTPLIAICCLVGFNTIQHIKLSGLRKTLYWGSLAYVLIFSFTSNPAAIDWKKEMNLTEAEQIAQEVANYIHSSELKSHRFIYTDPFLGEALKIDPFDADTRLILSKEALLESKKGDVIIWDNWHSVTDYSIHLEDLSSFKQLKSFETEKSTYTLFLVE